MYFHKPYSTYTNQYQSNILSFLKICLCLFLFLCVLVVQSKQNKTFTSHIWILSWTKKQYQILKNDQCFGHIQKYPWSVQLLLALPTNTKNIIILTAKKNLLTDLSAFSSSVKFSSVFFGALIILKDRDLLKTGWVDNAIQEF